MQHVVIEGPGRVRVAEAPDPVPPGPGRGRGVGRRHRHLRLGHALLRRRPRPRDGHPGGSRVPRHGARGRARTCGDFRPGDRVLTASVAGCGGCAGCATGDPVRCVEGPKVFGSGMLPGGQATAVAVPAADFQMLADPRGDGRRGGPAAHGQPVHRMGRGPAGRLPAGRHRRGPRARGGGPVCGAVRAGARCGPGAGGRPGGRSPGPGGRVGCRGARGSDRGGGDGGDRWGGCRRGHRRGGEGRDARCRLGSRASGRHGVGHRGPRPRSVPAAGAHDPVPECHAADDHGAGPPDLGRAGPAGHATGDCAPTGSSPTSSPSTDAADAYAAVAERSPECIKVLLRP